MTVRGFSLPSPRFRPPPPRPSATALIRWLLRRGPLHLVLIGIVLLWSIPTIALFLSSFRDPADIATTGWWNIVKAPFDLTLENYDAVINQRGLGRAFLNSFIITVPSTVLVLFVAALAAYAFAWMRFPGRGLIFLIVVGLLVVPLQMTLIPLLQLYTSVTIDADLPIIGGNIFGTSSYPGIWLAHAGFGLPFAVYLLRNFFGSLPRDLFEAAHMDGASDLQVFFRIALPLALPAIASLAIFQFLWVWNDLLIALIFLGDPDLAPITLKVSNLVSSFGQDYELLTAAAFISMIVPLIIFFALQRFFVQGLLAGSVKG